jgi:hypothetical protein
MGNAEGPSFQQVGLLSRHAVEQECWAARLLFFERGSDELEDEYLDLLRGWTRLVRADKIDGHIEVEAGGDGTGSKFDVALSFHRVERLKRVLRENGLAHLPVEVRPYFLKPDREPDSDPRSEDEKGRYGFVRMMVRDAPEFHPGSNVVRHCLGLTPHSPSVSGA